MVTDALFALFDEYMQASKSSTTLTSFNSNNVEEGEPSDSIFEEFDKYDNDDSGSAKQSQLQVYLLESRAKRTSSINILEYWKAQQFRYPELARLAMDILCVPVSTVASESAFSLGGRILDQYRSSMKPDIVEALVCTRDWLFGEKIPINPDVDVQNLTQNIMEMKISDDKKRSYKF